MGLCRDRISLFLCSMQREIPHLHKPWHYSLFNLFGHKHEHKFENNTEIVLLEFLRYVVEPYRKYPNLLEVLLNFLKTEQAIGIRREVCSSVTLICQLALFLSL